MVVCVLIITTLKEKLSCRRREVHRRRVSIMIFPSLKTMWVEGDCWFIVQYDITFAF